MNSFTNLIHRGGIYWVSENPKKPTIGHMIWKNRPGVVVSSDESIKSHNAVMVVFLTTSPKEESPAHCAISTADKPSTAICEQVTTVDKSQIGNYIGTVTEEEMLEIQDCICSALGIEWEDDEITISTQKPGPETETSLLEEEYNRLQEEHRKLQAKYDRLRDFAKDLM